MENPSDEVVEELSAKINDIMRHGDPAMREMLRDLIREFHNQVMADPKSRASMKSQLKALGDKIVKLPLVFKTDASGPSRAKAPKAGPALWAPVAAVLFLVLAAGAFVAWRGPATSSRQVPPNRVCDIKGNINPDGERIYHLKNNEWYGKAFIDETRGERWFCSEDEAKGAGWRRAQR